MTARCCTARASPPAWFWRPGCRRGSGLCSGQDAERLAAHLAAVGLPTELDQVDPGRGWTADDLIGHMTKDKKARDGRIVFVLLDQLGRAAARDDIDRATVRALLDRPRAA